jgi:purine-binding chemotaxis protein CheW
MSVDTGAVARPAAVASSDGQVVVLRVHEGDYAVPIGRVQEIIRVPSITQVPGANHGVEGIINLRGQVVPVIDLGIRLGMGPSRRPREARVVVVDSGSERVGLLVDGVSEVLRINHGAVEPPSMMTVGDGPVAVEGIAKLNDRLVLLLDLDVALGG